MSRCEIGAGRDDLDVHAPAGGLAQHLDGAGRRAEVADGHANAASGRLGEHVHDGGHVVPDRAGRRPHGDDEVGPVECRPAFARRRLDAAVGGPCRHEPGRQHAHRRAHDPHGVVAVLVGAAGIAPPAVGDPEAAGEAHAPVAHHGPAVEAVVLGGRPPPVAQVMAAHLAAGCTDLVDPVALELAAPEGVGRAGAPGSHGAARPGACRSDPRPSGRRPSQSTRRRSTPEPRRGPAKGRERSRRRCAAASARCRRGRAFRGLARPDGAGRPSARRDRRQDPAPADRPTALRSIHAAAPAPPPYSPRPNHARAVPASAPVPWPLGRAGAPDRRRRSPRFCIGASTKPKW